MTDACEKTYILLPLSRGESESFNAVYGVAGTGRVSGFHQPETGRYGTGGRTVGDREVEVKVSSHRMRCAIRCREVRCGTAQQGTDAM